MGTNGKLSLLMCVSYRNNRDLFGKVTPLMPKTFVLALNKIFVILKYIVLKCLKLCLYTLGRAENYL